LWCWVIFITYFIDEKLGEKFIGADFEKSIRPGRMSQTTKQRDGKSLLSSLVSLNCRPEIFSRISNATPSQSYGVVYQRTVTIGW